MGLVSEPRPECLFAVNIEVIIVGNELLSGALVDKHTAWLGERLARQGLTLWRGQTVPDEREAIMRALTLASGRSELVFVTGGLGPTEDDLTVDAAAEAFGLALHMDSELEASIKARYEARGRPWTERRARQALVPSGAAVLSNAVGTAPALRIRYQDTVFFFFPGVPRELYRLWDDWAEPWLKEHAPARPYRRAMLKLFGLTESRTAELLADLPSDPRLHLAYRAHFPEIHLTFHVADSSRQAGQDLLERSLAYARRQLGAHIYGDASCPSLAASLGELLQARHQTVAIAESCTGGMVSSLCVDVPGSSAWFQEGCVTYSNQSKTARLDVPAQLLASHGAVSEPVARAMAEGIRARSQATYGLAITGVAGPGGGSKEKPVGTVHIAVAGPAETRHLTRVMPYDRQRNRTLCAWLVLDHLRRWLLDTEHVFS